MTSDFIRCRIIRHDTGDTTNYRRLSAGIKAGIELKKQKVSHRLEAHDGRGTWTPVDIHTPLEDDH